MKIFKKSCLAVILLSTFSQLSYAAQELSPERANALESFKEVSTRGQFYNETDYARAISKIADKEGAAYFYITSTNTMPKNDSLRIVYAKLYKQDAAEVTEKADNFREFAGVYEYPKTKAIRFEPYDIVRLRGYFPTQYQLNTAVAKEASAKGAYAFFIDRSVELNGGNQQITAYLFKKDAVERKLQPDDAIPYDSEAGQLALAQGGEAAMQVERPGYYSSSAFNEQFYVDKFKSDDIKDVNADQSTTTLTKETKAAATPVVQPPADSRQASIIPQKSSRYTVTLPDGSQIEELNDATAAKMVPFDTIKFRGYYVSDQQISYNAGKKALANGAKYYHISRISQDTKGPNKTIYVDLYR
ncbi:uncharacterized protein DUF1471 [Orbus hercynius]|uniref:Uncharacterized protein DUF1471 n=1 Tax=Orbus hercynius TaxID=593135 RepID=A0A495RJ88_9GAMM|nr:YdgH/BhsA/McbA-like domain containing protein [Orbus hercynius]RKS87515.1 uncharacterized protein DUF1471 [Orbus hercynius]